MELVAELWDESINVSYLVHLLYICSNYIIKLTDDSVCQQAEFVPLSDPSLTEQYEYASEHDIKCLVVIDSGVSQKGSVKVGSSDHIKSQSNAM